MITIKNIRIIDSSIEHKFSINIITELFGKIKITPSSYLVNKRYFICSFKVYDSFIPENYYIIIIALDNTITYTAEDIEFIFSNNLTTTLVSINGVKELDTFKLNQKISKLPSFNNLSFSRFLSSELIHKYKDAIFRNII